MRMKHWALVAIGLTVVLLALVLLEAGYRALGTGFLPLGPWLSCAREQAEKAIRPTIRALGWLFLSLALAAVQLSVIAIAGGW
jgi:hypothetical protein